MMVENNSQFDYSSSKYIGDNPYVDTGTDHIVY